MGGGGFREVGGRVRMWMGVNRRVLWMVWRSGGVVIVMMGELWEGEGFLWIDSFLVYGTFGEGGGDGEPVGVVIWGG